ncbi:unnamed protein product [Soboliphyme baturini]|uniref:Uncharacterized protein n=1 Tax=Soboliphyme baturini TaxID=241478 RepID=A0A183IA78_9BILA|nr:unnamed protein product [Soboliphyme baturini]
MRTLRLFYSNHECTCGQLVIANHESQYKILHFHNGGLDKLAQIFEQWSALRVKSQRNPEVPSNKLSVQFSVVNPQLKKLEQHPEDELYDKVTWDYWRSCTSQDRFDDDIIRKVFFGIK